jgi:uncharacterized membrane protein required for colicin V production
VLLSIFALVATAAVAYMGAVQGLHRAAQTLVACLLAGVIALGLCGPLSGLVVPEQPEVINSNVSRLYFFADAVALWAVFAAVMLGLMTLAQRFLPDRAKFPRILNRAGGAILGAVTGYLAVGLCTILVQMLPTSPELLGYEAFIYKSVGGEESFHRGDPLWLRWDRGTLSFFGYLTRWPLGSKESYLFQRYGDVCPPKEKRGTDYGVNPQTGQPLPLSDLLDADDFLYYHWYRRYEYIFWGTGKAMGPVPEPARLWKEGPGLVLRLGYTATLNDVTLRIVSFERKDTLPEFGHIRPATSEDLLLVTVNFRPAGSLPHTIDSSQFNLLETLGGRIRHPLIYASAQVQNGQPQVLADSNKPAEITPRQPRYDMTGGQSFGRCLMEGATFRFTDKSQFEVRTLVFVVPRREPYDQVRLDVDAGPSGTAPKPAPKPTTRPATAR